MTKMETLRMAGIQGTVARWLNADADHMLVAGATRDGIAFTINGLAALGRSPRWKLAITRWADMVTDDQSDLRWALLQGSVGATHAA